MIRSNRCARASCAITRSSEDDLKAIDGEIRAIIAEAVDFASHDPEPDPAELWTDVLK